MELVSIFAEHRVCREIHKHLNCQWGVVQGLKNGAPYHSTIRVQSMPPATTSLPNGRGLFPILRISTRPRVIHTAWVVSVWLGVAGCVYIPPIGEQDATRVDLAGFAVGGTSRDDVLSVLGDPLINDGRFILDELYSSDGGFLLVAQYAAGYIPIGVEHTRLLLEFNEADVLERMDVERGGYASQFGGVTPDERPLQELEPLGEPISFNEVSWLSGAPIFHAAAFSPNGNLIAASDSSDEIFLIDFESRTIERISPKGYDTDGWATSIAFSPDGNSLAIQSRTIRIIDLKTRKQTVLYDGHGNAYFWEWKGASAMAYGPSGEVIASVGSGGNVKIWEASSGREIASWLAHDEGARAIAFSTDGAMLATSGGDGFVRLWDRKTGAEVGAVNRVGKPAFSDDGKLLAIASWTHAELWRLGRDSLGTSQGQKLALDGPMDMIVLPYFYLQRHLWGLSRAVSPSFTAGGRRLLHSAGSTVIWDLTERRKTPLAVPSGDKFLAFGPDGRTMATAGADGVRLWKLPVAEGD